MVRSMKIALPSEVELTLNQVDTHGNTESNGLSTFTPTGISLGIYKRATLSGDGVNLNLTLSHDEARDLVSDILAMIPKEKKG